PIETDPFSPTRPPATAPVPLPELGASPNEPRPARPEVHTLRSHCAAPRSVPLHAASAPATLTPRALPAATQLPRGRQTSLPAPARAGPAPFPPHRSNPRQTPHR